MASWIQRGLVKARAYHFATEGYASAFRDVPDASGEYARRIRARAVQAVDEHVPASWYDQPVMTLLKGKPCAAGATVPTVDAFGRENGHLIEAPSREVDSVIAHIRELHSRARAKDLRAAVRAIEGELLDADGPYAPSLVANQALDFGKQDGITEMVEAVEANHVERALADSLLADEAEGRVVISRAPAFVACVSNFSNFLDLCRKVLRNLELGVPVVVLSRSNTTQHMFRWSSMLVALLEQHALDTGLVTYLAASLPEQQRVIRSVDGECPLYFTGSRAVAAAIREEKERTIASTGGPNTLVSTTLTPEVKNAIRLSAAIESAGQCTALRHAIVPCSSSDAEAILRPIAEVEGPAPCMREGSFASVLSPALSAAKHSTAGYTAVGGGRSGPVASVRLSSSLPPPAMDECWRRVVVDFTAPRSAEALKDSEFVSQVASWLVRAQPISVAVNDEDRDGFALAKRLFELTGVVVFTCGSPERPAFTCQARPQSGEVFGEFPVRADLPRHTRFPVVVPSPTPVYNASYDVAYLARCGKAWDPASNLPVAALAGMIVSDEVRGFVAEIFAYLADVCTSNPKRAPNTGRTALFGLQRPPLNGQPTVLRAGEGTTMDSIAPHLAPFVTTNAAVQLFVSVHPTAEEHVALAVAKGLLVHTQVRVEDEAAFDERMRNEACFNVISAKDYPWHLGYPPAGLFVSTHLCLGHVKSTQPDDEAFLRAFTASDKWLALRGPLHPAGASSDGPRAP